LEFKQSIDLDFDSRINAVVLSTNCMKFSLRVTKSVSQFISAITAVVAFDNTRISPSAAVLEERLAAAARPFSRNILTALSISASDSVKAFLQSIGPAPVFSRSSCTILAVITAIL